LCRWSKEGFALCTLLKKKTQGKIPLLLVTSTLTRRDIELHQKQKLRADAYFDKRDMTAASLRSQIEQLVDLGPRTGPRSREEKTGGRRSGRGAGDGRARNARAADDASSRLAAVIAERDEEIEELKAELEDAQLIVSTTPFSMQYVDLRKQLLQKEKEIDALIEEGNDSNRKTGAAKRKITELEEKVRQLNGTLETSQKSEQGARVELQSVSSELARNQAEIDNLRRKSAEESAVLSGQIASEKHTREMLRADYEDRIAELKKAAERANAESEERRRILSETLNREHERTLETLQGQHQTVLATFEARYKADLEEADRKRAEALELLAQEHAKELGKIEQRYSREKGDVALDKQREFEAQIDEITNRAEQRAAEYEARLAESERAYAELKEQSERFYEDSESKHGGEVEQLKRTMHDMREKHAEELRELERRLDAEKRRAVDEERQARTRFVEEEKTRLETAVSGQKSASESVLRVAQQEHAAEMERLRRSLEDEKLRALAEKEDELASRIDAVSKDYEAKLAELEGATKEMVAETSEFKGELESQYATQIAKVREELASERERRAREL
jgi:hypothetical protein